MSLGRVRLRKLVAPAFIALAAAVVSIGFSDTVNASYAQVRVHNFAPVPVTANIIYAGCRHDSLYIPAAIKHGDKITPTSAAKSAGHYEQHHKHIWRWWKSDDPRGSCLVTRIDVSFHGKYEGKTLSVDSYRSSGTSYSQFGIYQRSATRFRVMSNAEIRAEKNTAGMSPGFKIHNRSTIPLTISLDQVGCLYYENNVLPGQTFDRDTGAVWFTIRAKLYDPKQRTNNWACAEPVIEYVGGALMAAATMGAGLAWTAGAEAAVAAGAEAGAAAAAESAAESIMSSMAKEAIKKILVGAGLTSMGVAFADDLAANTAATNKGEYAGPPWPFRCKHKPEYEITGGPDWSKLKGAKTQAEVDERMIQAFSSESPLKITKINGCN